MTALSPMFEFFMLLAFVAVFLAALLAVHVALSIVRAIWRLFFPPTVRVKGVHKWNNK